jgi:hypothetical protein
MKRFLCIRLRVIPSGLNALFPIAIAGTLLSCNEQSISTYSEQANPIELIDYKGETATVPTSFPKELFDQSPEEFENYYRSLSINSKTNASAEISILPYEDCNKYFRNTSINIPK